MHNIALPALLAVAALLCGRIHAGSPAPPHILFMVVDDLGWNDISWHNPQIRSPRIHALAEAGVKLVNHHTFKWCSPSRSSIMTGRYPYHLGQQTNINMNPATTLPCGIHPSYDFIPKLLRSHGGYATVRALSTSASPVPLRACGVRADSNRWMHAQHALGKWQ